MVLMTELGAPTCGLHPLHLNMLLHTSIQCLWAQSGDSDHLTGASQKQKIRSTTHHTTQTGVHSTLLIASFARLNMNGNIVQLHYNGGAAASILSPKLLATAAGTNTSLSLLQQQHWRFTKINSTG